MAIERTSRPHGDLAGDHGFDESSRLYGVASGGDSGEIGRRRGHLLDQIAVGGGDRLRGGSEVVIARPIVLDSCHPAVAGGRLDHHHTRDDDLAGLAGNERDPPDAHGSDAERRLVVVGDSAQGGGRLVEWDTPGDATTRQADAVADEQIAIAAGDVVEVERSCRFVGDDGGGTHQRSRVPVNSCATPSVS